MRRTRKQRKPRHYQRMIVSLRTRNKPLRKRNKHQKRRINHPMLLERMKWLILINHLKRILKHSKNQLQSILLFQCRKQMAREILKKKMKLIQLQLNQIQPEQWQMQFKKLWIKINKKKRKDKRKPKSNWKRNLCKTLKKPMIKQLLKKRLEHHKMINQLQNQQQLTRPPT